MSLYSKVDCRCVTVFEGYVTECQLRHSSYVTESKLCHSIQWCSQHTQKGYTLIRKGSILWHSLLTQPFDTAFIRQDCVLCFEYHKSRLCKCILYVEYSDVAVICEGCFIREGFFLYFNIANRGYVSVFCMLNTVTWSWFVKAVLFVDAMSLYIEKAVTEWRLYYSNGKYSDWTFICDSCVIRESYVSIYLRLWRWMMAMSLLS